MRGFVLVALLAASHGLASAQEPAPAPPRPLNAQPPRVLSRVNPVYPAEAMRERIQGVVMLQAMIEPDGSVGDVRVVRSLDPRLDAAAVDAVKQWRYEPATVDGKPVRIVATVSMSFNLAGAPPVLSWPEGFTPDADALLGSAWIDEVAVSSGLEFRVSAPQGWSIQKQPPSPEQVLTMRDATKMRTVTVFVPRPSVTTLDRPLSIAQLQTFALDLQRTNTARGTPMQEPLSGQVTAPFGGGYWIWLETQVATDDLAKQGPQAMAFTAQLFERIHTWAFTATVGKQMVTVTCGILVPRGPGADEQQKQIRQAAADFGAIMRRISIQPAP